MSNVKANDSNGCFLTWNCENSSGSFSVATMTKHFNNFFDIVALV